MFTNEITFVNTLSGNFKDAKRLACLHISNFRGTLVYVPISVLLGTSALDCVPVNIEILGKHKACVLP